ncbi:hypothetical protein L0F63_007490 [Massospora cicadina]|nr:hypothetical protein L0F63_007490 [Massospora cicadina]
MKLIVLWLGFSLGFNLTQLDYDHRLCQGIDIREMTISKAQELQLSGKLSAFNLTECYLERIEVLNPTLHAVIETNPDALKIAEEKDELAKSGILSGLLHGVPILIKDNIATGDKMETTAGSLALVGMKPIKDATVISRLREAGAIILGKANLSELDGSPRGSSSGSAVGLAANMCLAALGTETDGSIVAPASVNGVVGLKPTVGSIPMDGIIPVAASQDSVGPMARTISDANILYSAMMIEEQAPPLSLPSDLRVGIFHNDSAAHVIKSIKGLKQITEIKGNVTLSILDEIINKEIMVLLRELKYYMSVYLSQVETTTSKKITSIEDIVKFNKVHDAIHPQYTLEAIKPHHDIKTKKHNEAQQYIKRESKRMLDGLLLDNHVEFIAGSSNSAYFNRLCAISGYPVIALPAGYGEDGVPFGMLFCTKPNNEHLLLSLANEFEKVVEKRRLPTYLP